MRTKKCRALGYGARFWTGRLGMQRSAEALFTGSHTNKIDAKGRLATPADFRRALDTEQFNGFVCVPSLEGPYLDCGGLDLLERLQARLATLDPYDLDREAMEIAIMGRMRKLSLDKDGRISLPRPFIKHAGLEGDASFIGRGEFFQIWNSAVMEERLSAAVDRAQKARFSLRSGVMQRPNGDISQQGVK